MATRRMTITVTGEEGKIDLEKLLSVLCTMAREQDVVIHATIYRLEEAE